MPIPDEVLPRGDRDPLSSLAEEWRALDRELPEPRTRRDDDEEGLRLLATKASSLGDDERAEMRRLWRKVVIERATLEVGERARLSVALIRAGL